jgi:hypothetical protein
MSNISSHFVSAHRTSERSAALPILFWFLKAAALWIVLIASSIVAMKVLGMTGPVPPQDGPLSVTQAFPLVNVAIALVLALLAARARNGGLRLAVVLFTALFFLQTGMALIEAYWFNDAVHMSVSQMTGWGEQALIVAASVGVAGALLFHPGAEPAADIPSNLVVRILLLAAIYVVLYFAAGYFIAWQSAAVRAYYTTHGASIPGLAPTVVLQFGRGILWAMISLLIVSQVKGSLMSRALLMALLFGVVTAAQLLYPNALMPWPVRRTHLIEVGSSEAAYGIIATYVLLAGAMRKPLPAKSPWRLLTGRA